MSIKIDSLTETKPVRRLPVLALRGLVIFPGMLLQFDVGRKRSIRALNLAMEGDQTILLAAQKDLSENEPGGDQIYRMGVVASIKQVITHSGEGIRLFAEGERRACIMKVVQEDPCLIAEVVELEEPEAPSTPRSEALIRRTQSLFEEYLQNYRKVPPDIILNVLQKKECGTLADYLAANIMLDFTLKQEILEELNPAKRLERLDKILENEIRVLQIENELNEKTREQIDQNQKEYFLREQLKAISSELGEGEDPRQEADEFRTAVLALKLGPEQEEKLLRECDRLARMPYSSQEGSVIRTYLETCLALPWNKSSREKIDLAKAQRVLDRDHYGLQKVKERILETLAVRKLAPDSSGQILCLVGPPGVGKTSIARSIASAIGRKYVRVSLGGVRDESDIMGHRRTYVGSMPGRIIHAMRQAGVNNPLILLDEIDKLGHDFRGDPASSLLEVLDSEQNSAFYDHYIDMPFDLSKVLFLTTANDPSTIPGPLYDRMDVINLPSYTHEEKFQIASRHLVPKQIKKHGLTAKQLRISREALHSLIDGYTREAGVRTLERTIASLCRKAAREIVENPDAKVSVQPKDLERLIGPRKFKPDALEKTDEIGLVNGLAWTSVGGEMMQLEAAVMEGSGKIELTGSLGDVMKESAQIAVSCIRQRAAALGIPHDFHTKCDIHVHAPEGAVPKDGPSAGVAMVTVMVSALTGIPIRHDTAMTGEITLRGRVLPIGGLREKTMAAYRSGLRHVLIPEDNVPDLADVDPVVKEAVEFHPVSRIDEVLNFALVRCPELPVVPVPEDACRREGTAVLPPPVGAPSGAPLSCGEAVR